MFKRILVLTLVLVSIAGTAYAWLPTKFTGLYIRPTLPVETPAFRIYTRTGTRVRWNDNMGNASTKETMVYEAGAAVSGLVVAVCDVFDTVVISDSVSVLTSAVLKDLVTGGIITAQPLSPRNLNVVLYTYGESVDVESARSVWTVGIHGMVARGYDVVETLTFDVMPSDSVTTKVTSYAYRYIRAVYVCATLGDSAPNGSTMSIGVGPSLGLANDIYGDTILWATQTTSNAPLAVTLHASAAGYVSGTVDGTYDLYTPATAWGDAQRVTVCYKAKIKVGTQ